MRVFLAALSVYLFVATAAAQVQTSIQSIGPVVVQATDGSNTVTNTTAGPIGPQGEVVAALPGGNGGGAVRWDTAETYASISHGLSNPNTLTSFSGSSFNTFVVEFTTPTPRAATLNAIRYSALSSGAPAGSVAVDVGDDGTFETFNLSPLSVTSWPVTLGPQPFRVRLVVGVTLAANEFAQEDVSFQVIPDNDLQITRIVHSCAPFLPPPPPVVQPSFQHLGIDMVQPFSIGVMALGLSPQANLLSTFSLTGLPCILVPQPVVTLLAPNALLDLPIPATARPITLYVQAAGLVQGELVTSDGYQVQAL